MDDRADHGGAVAIIGLACRFPGAAEPAEFPKDWRPNDADYVHNRPGVDGAYVLAGHEHPVYVIASRADSVRVPCFRFAARCGVLPAFGAVYLGIAWWMGLPELERAANYFAARLGLRSLKR